MDSLTMNDLGQGHIDQLRTRIIRILGKKGYWGSEESIRQRMSRDFKTFDSGHYSYFLSEEFDQSLIHIPNAFDFVVQRRDDYERVNRAIVLFTNAGFLQLRSAHLFEAIVDAMRAGLSAMTEVLDCTKTESGNFHGDNDFRYEPGGATPLDSFWDSVLETRIPYGKDGLFPFLFVQWMENFTSPDSSASVLLFVLRTKCYPCDLEIHRDPLVLKYAFDRKTCCKHWESAGDLISKQCSKVYVEAIRKQVLEMPRES